MSKYIIDTETWANLFEVQRVGVYGIGNDIVTDEKTVWSRMFSLDELEELNSDYINEHYGELQDEAYQRGLEDGKKSGYEKGLNAVGTYRKGHAIGYEEGFEDGKKSKEKGCDGCKYELCGDTEDPCWHCRKNYKDKYEPAPHSYRIEVGDEVVWNNDTTLTITRVHKLDDDEWCDGMAEDGAMYGVLKSNVRKTGKHYDIQSILEAMRTHD